MNGYPMQHYIDRRDECLRAAAEIALPNARKRHLEAAEAWQQIIDRISDKRMPLSGLASMGSNA
jgi:hypothetical protein